MSPFATASASLAEQPHLRFVASNVHLLRSSPLSLTVRACSDFSSSIPRPFALFAHLSPIEGVHPLFASVEVFKQYSSLSAEVSALGLFLTFHVIFQTLLPLQVIGYSLADV